MPFVPTSTATGLYGQERERTYRGRSNRRYGWTMNKLR